MRTEKESSLKIHVGYALIAPGFAALLASCGGGDGPTRPPPPPVVVAASISAVSPTTLTGTVGQQLSVEPSVIVRNQSGSAVSGVTVVFTVASGGGSVPRASAVTDNSGVATPGAWMLGTRTGANTLTAAAGSLPVVTFTANAGPGPPASMSRAAGDDQLAEPGAAVPIAPAVLVKDQFDNPVAGATVTFTPSSGGSVTGATATADTAGLARVGSWTLGPTAGPNTLTATSGSLPPVVFNANAGSITIASVSPALLLPGASATITGSNFSPSPSANAVTIDGAAATVSAATSTQLTITVPAPLPCGVTRDAPVRVTVGGATATRAHPVQSGKQRSLAVGQSLVIPAGELRCNELAVSGGRYYLSVYNTSSTYSTSGAPFDVVGTASSTSGSSAAALAPAPARLSRSPGPAPVQRDSRVDPRGELLHLRLLEANARILRDNRALLPQARRTGARFAAEPVAPPNVGDLRTLRIPKVTQGGFCSNYIEITARVAHVGARSIIVEDTANALDGRMDSTYAAVGAEFDNVMFGLLQTNFGNPLAMDAATDNNGRIVMVFSKVINEQMPGLAGFVVSCDFFRRSSTITQSNFGEHFYALAATRSGTIEDGGSPPSWARSMRSTILHEVKHITSFGERISRNGGSSFEASWLEESTARVSEELYARSIYGLGQNANIPYGSSTNPRGPYCEVRRTAPPACVGYPIAAQKQIQGLANGFYRSSEDHSPIGRRDSEDFSFYNTAWSLVRWAIDHGAATESAFLRGLTQEPNLSGVANLVARAGRSFADMIPEWTLAMAADDYPGMTPANARLTMPSWNLRDVYAGLNADFSGAFPRVFPLVAKTHSFGSFTIGQSVLPGTTSFIELSGTLTGRQAIELKAAGSHVNAPSEIGLALVRVQ